MSFSVACLLYIFGWVIYTLVEARKQGKKFSYWLVYIEDSVLDQVLAAAGGILVMVLWRYTGITIPLPDALGGSLELVQGQYTAAAGLIGYLAIQILDKVTMLLGAK